MKVVTEVYVAIDLETKNCIINFFVSLLSTYGAHRFETTLQTVMRFVAVITNIIT